MKESISVDQLIEQARRFVGSRWAHQGRNFLGVDCIGLVTESIRNAGLDPAQVGYIDPKPYSRNATPIMLEQAQMYCEQIPEPVPGAMLLFLFPNDEWPRHFGIFTRDGTIVHANSRLLKVVEHGYRMHWVKWTHSCWKLPGVTYDE